MEKSQNALVRGRQLCTQLSVFWRKPRRIVLFLMDKHSESRPWYLCTHLHLLSSNLSLLSASSLLCFSSVHIVGSLTSKLPSIMRYSSHSREPHEYLQMALIFSTPWKNLPFWRKRGNPRCFFREAQNASGRQAEIRRSPDVFSQKSKCTEVWIG